MLSIRGTLVALIWLLSSVSTSEALFVNHGLRGVSDSVRASGNDGRYAKTRLVLSLAREGVEFVPNTIQAEFYNDGIYFEDLATGNDGLFWPAHSGKNAVFTSGPWLIGTGADDDSLYSASCEYVTEYQPGPIVTTYNGDSANASEDAADPQDSSWDIMVLSGSTPPTDSTYQAWIRNAPQTGAPLNSEGQPSVIGDEVAYWVMNDLSVVEHGFVSVTPPMGTEVHNYVFGFNRVGTLGQTLFIRMTFINRSTKEYDSCYVGWWSDCDLGNAIDDLDGCDTTRDLGYTYNGKSSDVIYGADPPAEGYVLLEGPKVRTDNSTDSALQSGMWVHGYKNLTMTSFIMFLNSYAPYDIPPDGNHVWSKEAYNLLRGLVRTTGQPFLDNGSPTKFLVSGDPVTHTGWVDTLPGDKHLLLSSGPFDLLPGDTQEIVLAYVIGQGTSNINSVEVLRKMADTVRAVFNSNFTVFTPVHTAKNDIPQSYSLSQNYPNPFNPTTVISYGVPVNSQVTLKVYDVLGREVQTLVDENKHAGSYRLTFNAGNLPSGVYFLRLQAGSFGMVKKMVLLK